MIFIISFCILVSIGQWKQFNGYANDSRFANIVHHLPSFFQSPKSDSTLKKYKCYFKKFERRFKSCSLQYLPATLQLFLYTLVDLFNKESVSQFWIPVFMQYSGIIIFILKIILVQINCYLIFLKVVTGKRLLSKPVCKKDPITSDILQRIIAVFGDRNDVSKLRICVLFLLEFSGFLRYSELFNIKMKNFEFQDTHE